VPTPTEKETKKEKEVPPGSDNPIISRSPVKAKMLLEYP
jgi:hypothetical protein